MRARWLGMRAVAAAIVLILVTVHLHALTTNLDAHNRLRERALEEVRSRLDEERAAIRSVIASPEDAPVSRALERLVASGLASRAEAFTEDGVLLAAVPSPGGAATPLTPDDLARLRQGRTLLTGPTQSGDVEAYWWLRPPGDGVVLRLILPAEQLVGELQAWRQLFRASAVTLVLLVALGIILTMPSRAANTAPAPRALVAYEEAMERLRTQGEEERRRLQENLHDQEPLARAGELTTGIVHEVRNGLGTIVGYARLIEKVGDADAASHGSSIREECEVLEQVVSRFMDFVQHRVLHPAPFDLARLLGRVAARESRSGPGAKVRVSSMDVGPVVGDEELLERAFENVVRNAREAAGPEGLVEIEAHRVDGVVDVTVLDDGPGLKTDARQLLRPFFTTKVGGLGLGLAITLKILRLHGGDLLMGDRLPRGLVVHLRLPQGDPL